MTPIYILLAIVALIAIAALAAHFLPKPSNTKLAQLDTDLNWLYDKAFPPAGTASVAGLAPAAAPLAHTITTFGGAPGDIIGTDSVMLRPVTGADLFAACMAARTGPGYTNAFGLWNSWEWLRRMDAKTFAGWCAAAAAQPGIAGSGNSVGWIQGLSADGQGFFETFGTQTPPLVIPDVDPRV